MNTKLTYTVVIAAIAIAATWLISSKNNSPNDNVVAIENEIVMYKNAGCQCCDMWAEYMENNGYKVSVKEVNNMAEIKKEKGVPDNMASCHTTTIDGYTIEGHIPIEDINRLLTEKPDVVGITAPGMPSSAPGMNTKLNDPYSVFVFDSAGNSTLFASH